MSINMDKINKLNDLVTTSLRRRHITVLNPGEKCENEVDTNQNDFIYDKIEWKIPEEIRQLVEELAQNRDLSNEEKILLIYEKLCEKYIYDDNLISYIQKVDDDSYVLPDWYGRDIDEEWEANRAQHNRRVCYEVSRYLAKSLMELFKNDEDYDICIFWDKSLTHYFVGLTCNEYSITLDVDDFNNIKDLTRIKAGLTAEGIVILEDYKEIFKIALDKFNEGRGKDAIKKIKNDINNETQNSIDVEENEKITFLKNVIDILKNKYEIDSQGIYEYIKEIVDVSIGPESRKKVWKEIKGTDEQETRYIRCLILTIDNQEYIIDVDKMLVRTFDEEEFKTDEREFIPYKELLNEGVVNFRGRKETRYTGR